MSDEHDTPGEPAPAAGDADAAGAGARAVHAGAAAIGPATAGDAAGAVGGIAGAAGGVAGATDGEAGDAVGTAAQVIQAGSQLAGAAQGLSRGDAAGAAQGLAGAAGASQYLVPDHEAQQALQAGSQAAGAAGQMLDALGNLTGGGTRVDAGFHLELDGLDGTWGVRHVDLREKLSDLYECVIEAAYPETLLEVGELLTVEAHLHIERGEQMRTVHGIVRHARVAEEGQGSRVTLYVVPAMWLLGQNLRSRSFTNRSIPQVVDEIYQERLGARRRTIRNDLTRTYPVHELLVQHQETDLAFVERRLEQEGIFTYFVHDGDHEELVLADTNSNLANVRESDGGRVHWCHADQPGQDGEGIFHAVHLEEVGAQDVIVTEYNWTAPDAPIRGEQTGRDQNDPPLEIYDHTRALTLFGYDNRRYAENDAAGQARIRAELLDLRRHRWELSSLCVALRPGHVVELVGCPDADLDKRYVIVSVSGQGSAREGLTGDYRNHVTVVPFDMPFRPARRTPAPVINGHQTAMVVGPSDQEIHTDEHGRVQIRFHWDREHEPSAHNDCSCWVRVMHSWAGPGFGTTFIPRIGMEVVLTFLNGDPDQPLVVGCVYHGTHQSPVVTPDDKTQSAIRTKSSMNSDGYNELRFEDKAGDEFISVHAQKDLNEVVEHCHSTHVKVDQSNTVDHDHTETVGNDQKLHVKNDRTKNVDNDEKTEIGGNRTEEVTGHEQIHIHEFRKVKVEDNEKLVVHGNREMHVDGRDDEEIVGGREVVVSEFDNLKVIAGANRNETISGQMNVRVAKKYDLVQNDSEKLIMDQLKTKLESGKEITLVTGSAAQVMKNDGNVTIDAATKVEVTVGGCKIEVTTSTIKLSAGPTSLELGPSGATLSGPTVTSSAQTMNEITGLLVKIN